MPRVHFWHNTRTWPRVHMFPFHPPLPAHGAAQQHAPVSVHMPLTPARGLAHAGTQRDKGEHRLQSRRGRAGRRGSFIDFKRRKTFSARPPRVPAPRRWPAGLRSRWPQWRRARAILWRTEERVIPESSPSLALPAVLPAPPRPYLRPGPHLQEGCCPPVLGQRWRTAGPRLQVPGCSWCSRDLHPTAIQWARSTGWDWAPGDPLL